MLFNSPEFLFGFLPVVLAGYLLILRFSTRLTKLWIVGASLIFYAWLEPQHLLWLALSMAVNWRAALLLASSRAPRSRKVLLAAGITFNLAVLFHYKYSGFIFSVLLAGQDQESISTAALPLAISFVTFTQIAYLIDVYQRETYRSSPLDYSFFALFFPHLIAGPILRHEEFGPQIHGTLPRPRFHDFVLGLFWLAIGLFKKIVLADGVAPVVDSLFNYSGLEGGITPMQAWTGTLAFTAQIYFDFSGYSDMAIGLARMFGLAFPINFDAPYRAVSLQDFWARWHMTLSRFLRDYIYIPLGGNRKGPARQTVNLMITMIISGLWHGAGWTFLIWGALHGAYLVVTRLWVRLLASFGIQRTHPLVLLVGWALTFTFVVTTWVYFRATSLSDAHLILVTMFGGGSSVRPGPDDTAYFVYVGVFVLLAILLPPTHRILPNLESWPEASEGSLPVLRRLAVPAAAFATAVMSFVVIKSFFSAQASQFIYFKF